MDCKAFYSPYCKPKSASSPATSPTYALPWNFRKYSNIGGLCPHPTATNLVHGELSTQFMSRDIFNRAMPECCSRRNNSTILPHTLLKTQQLTQTPLSPAPISSQVLKWISPIHPFLSTSGGIKPHQVLIISHSDNFHTLLISLKAFTCFSSHVGLNETSETNRIA